MGMGMGVTGGMGGKGGAQDSQVYYDSSKGQYYTMAQPQRANNPWGPMQQAVSAVGGKGGADGRTYIGSSLNQDSTGAVNSLANYTAPQFNMNQQNPYASYYAQREQRRNPWARTEFGQMPDQQQVDQSQQQTYQQQPPWAQQQSYYQGPFQQYGMGGKGGYQQPNPYSQQINYGQQPQYGGKGFGGGYGALNNASNMIQQRAQQYPGMSAPPGMGGKGGGAPGAGATGGMGGKGKGMS